MTQYPGWPDEQEAHARIREALPYLGFVRGTSISWGIRMILGELYDWHEPITEANWECLDAVIRERADDGAWHREILRRANVEQCGSEIARREHGEADDVLFYALEWGFFTRCQWGEFDTALYELERCWGPDAGDAVSHRHGGAPSHRTRHPHAGGRRRRGAMVRRADPG